LATGRGCVTLLSAAFDLVILILDLVLAQIERKQQSVTSFPVLVLRTPENVFKVHDTIPQMWGTERRFWRKPSWYWTAWTQLSGREVRGVKSKVSRMNSSALCP